MNHIYVTLSLLQRKPEITLINATLKLSLTVIVQTTALKQTQTIQTIIIIIIIIILMPPHNSLLIELGPTACVVPNH